MSETMIMEPLEVLVGEAGRKLEISGQCVHVTPIRVRELPAFLRAIEPIGQALAGGDVASALAANAEALIAATAIGARVDPAWLADQEIDALFDLAVAVVEVNGDFFVTRVMPALARAAEKLNREGGSMPPPPSSPVDIPTRT